MRLKIFDIKSFVFIVSFLFFAQVFAQNKIVWTGNAGNKWNTPANWNPEKVPGSEDIAVFDKNAVVKLPSEIIIGGLEINSIVEFEKVKNISINSGISVLGNLIVPENSLLNLSGKDVKVKILNSNANLKFDSKGNVELTGPVVTSGNLIFVSGDFNTESFNIDANKIIIRPEGDLRLIMNESLVTVNNLDVESTENLDFYSGDSHIYIKNKIGNKLKDLNYHSLSFKGVKASFSTDCSSTDATCHGVCDGTITVDLASGSPNYPVTIRLYYPSDLGGGYVDYTNINSLPYTISGLCGSSQPYTVKVTDFDGDAQWCNVYVLEPGEMIVADDDVQDVQCYGECDGYVQINYIQNAQYPVSYLWSNGDTTDKADSLCADSVYVTVTDDKGCQKVFGYLITQPDSFYTDMDVTNPTCNGSCDGEATVTPHGGTSPYSYSWNTGDTDSTITNLCAAQYTVTVTDDNGCEIYDTANVVDPPALSTTTSGTDPTCNGSCDGSATVSVSGGTTPYSYNWSTGETTQSINNLCAGTYYVTVTDANGCQKTDSVSLTDPAGMTLTIDSTNVSCNGACDGSATVNVSGGVSPYSYSWSNGETTQTINNLCAGTYYVTVTDNDGCQKTDSVEIDEPPALTSTMTENNPTCNGSCDGSATVNPSGGTSPYTYNWSTGDNTQTINNLCAGQYIVTVTDANGCQITDTANIVDPAPVDVTVSTTDPSCNGACDGSATANPSGGTSPYTYSWSNGDNTQTINNLCAGTYTVTVTDANGCTASESGTLNDPPALSVSFSTTDVSCNGSCDGSATANVSGGTSPYSYNWSNGETTQTINNLCAGTYNLTVTDANGCQKVDSVTISEPTEITINFSTTDVSCNGACDGSATANVSGGTSPYSYNWSNGETTQTINNLCAGTYNLTVTDANGCQKVDSVTITEPSAITTTVSTTDPQCNGGCDGSATVNPSGGTSPYTYNWSNGDNTQTTNNLCAGQYIVTVTDNNGCQVTDTAVINDPPGMTLSLSKTDVSCNGSCDGSASVSVSGGTSPYTYSWDNGSTDSTADNLCAGWHYVTVTDNNNCQKTDSIEITEPPVLSVSISSSTDPSCYGSCDGSATASPAGGTSPYAYSWSNGDNTQTATNLCAGTHTVTVTDANGCQAQASVTLNQPDSISLTLNPTDVSCNGSCDGAVSSSVSGGTSPYSYNWSNSETSQNINNVCAGNYVLTVTDANGCQRVDSAYVSEPPVLQDSISKTDVSCNGNCDGSATVYPYGGTSPYSYNWSNGDNTQTTNNLCAGTYTVTITDANGCQKEDTVTIVEPTAISLTTGTQDASCNGSCDGYAYVDVTGGTSPYTYNWSNGATTDTAYSLCAGNYTVTVTDANGCSETASVTINEPVALSAYVSSYDHPTCPGDCDGDITVTPLGGTSPYTYLWNTGSTTQTIDSLCAGTYTVTVTDAHGCQTTVTFDLQDPTPITTTIDVTDVTCNGLCNGYVNLGVNGGVTPYSYSWSNGATTEDISNACAGQYIVTVTDANGCQAIDTGVVSEPPALTASLTINSQPTCNGLCDGDVTVNVSGGTPSYTYEWNNGVTTQNDTTLCEGNVSVTVTDANSCQIVKDTTLVAPQVVTISHDTIINPSCHNTCDGVIDIAVSGGTTPYSYSWSNGSTTDSISSLCADTFIVTVTDANNCYANDTVVLIAPPEISDTFLIAMPLCYGDCNGGIGVQVSGGTLPYSYNWNTGSTSDTISGLCAGTYYLTITDANSCTKTDSIELTQPDFLVAHFSAVEPLCAGDCNGSIAVNVNGGTPTYSYVWNTTDTASTLNNICAGTYDVTVTDANGCQLTSDTTIAEPLPLQIQFTDSNYVTCFGGCDGSATINVSGGTTPYNYNWSNGDTTNVADSLCEGWAYVTVTDANLCSIVDSIYIAQPDSFYIQTDTITEAYCGQCVAYIVVSAHGGTPGYAYLWNTGDATDSIGGLCHNIYTVTVTDANGCQVSHQETVVDTSDMNLTLTVNNITCNGNCDGNIHANVTGGTPPYTYTWSNGETTDYIDSLCVGLYSVTVVDANNCTRVAQDSITQSDELSYTSVVNNVTCNGACNGSISISPGGGTQPYSVIWSTGSTDTSISNLCAGYYSFTLTDAHSCQKIDSIEITEPTMLEDTVYITDTIRCYGYDSATAVIVASGGVPPYTYSTPVGNTDTMSNIGAGWYVFTITDANGCQKTDSVEITQPDSVVFSFTDVNVIPCAGICTGHATATVSGGTAPYDFIWSNGDTTATADSLCGGYVTITVVDANGCIYNDSVAILDTSNLQVNVDSIILPVCYGDCNGSLIVSGSGGFPPYTYQWDTAAGSATTDSVGGLCAGDYVVTVTDDSGCYVVDTVTLPNPPALTISLDSNSTSSLIVCYQECNGAIGVVVNNGTSPYNYQWNYDPTIDTSFVDSLCAGNYSLTVTDANGCFATFDTVIISNPEITLDFDVTNPLCEYGSADGNIIANVSGGSGMYSYHWNTGNTSNQLLGLDGGVYYLTVTDSLGCSQSDSVFLNPQILVVARADTDTTICPGDTIMIYGFTNGQRFEWGPTTNMIDSTTLTPLVFPQDTTVYYFTAYDTICYNWDSVIVNVYERMNIDAGEDVKIIDGHYAQLYATGGHSGCTYHWFPSEGLSNDSVSNPIATPNTTTMYYVVVTDEHGCSEIDSIKVIVVPQLIIPNGITPNGDGINDVWVIDNIDIYPNVEIEIYNRWGELLFYSKGYPPSERWDGTYNGKKLPTGTYYYVIKLNDSLQSEPITGPITIMY